MTRARITAPDLTNQTVRWQFTEGSGLSVANSLSATVPLTLTDPSSNIWSTNSRLGDYCLDFDGGTTAKYGAVTSTAIVDNAGTLDTDADTALGIASWIYARDAGESNNGTIVDKTDWSLRFSSATDLTFTVKLGATSRTLSIPFNFNQWVHVAATFNQDGYTTNQGCLRIYINGWQAIMSGEYAGTVTDQGASLYVGDNSAGNKAFDGYIQDVVLSIGNNLKAQTIYNLANQRK